MSKVIMSHRGKYYWADTRDFINACHEKLPPIEDMGYSRGIGRRLTENEVAYFGRLKVKNAEEAFDAMSSFYAAKYENQ